MDGRDMGDAVVWTVVFIMVTALLVGIALGATIVGLCWVFF